MAEVQKKLLQQLDKEHTYVTIPDKVFYAGVIDKLKDNKDLAVDTETTGVDVLSDRCLGYSFSVKPGTAFWVPIKIDPRMMLFRRLIKGKRLILFNAGFDLAVIEKHIGSTLANDFVDVMIGCFFRDVINYRFAAGLKAQAELILDVLVVELKDIIKENIGKIRLSDDDVDFLQLEDWQQRIYGCQDADLTLSLWQHNEIQAGIATMPKIWELEHRLVRIVMKMHANGIGVDLAKMAEFDSILEQECAACNKRAHKLLWKELTTVNDDGIRTFRNPELARLTKKTGLNLSSFRQKQIVLFDELGLPTTRKTKTGYSTDALAMETLEDKHPVVLQMTRFARLTSRRTAYTRKIPGLIHPTTGRLHPSLWATGVKSGRFSCSNPNMQGVSRDQGENDPVHIREAFVSAKGNLLTVADYNQIELRIATSLSGEPKLHEAYTTGLDVHAMTARELFSVTEPTKEQRQTGKTANFSILTGIGPYMLYQRNRKQVNSLDAARELIKDWFAAYPRLAAWENEVKRQARAVKAMSTYFGRIRPFPDIRDPNPQLVSQRMIEVRDEPWAQRLTENELYDAVINSICGSQERKALSHLIQGTAADIMKIALVRVDQAIQKEKMPLQMLLTVHDELVCEHPAEIVKEAQDLITENMNMKPFADGWVSLPVDCKSGDSWATAK